MYHRPGHPSEWDEIQVHFTTQKDEEILGKMKNRDYKE